MRQRLWTMLKVFNKLHYHSLLLTYLLVVSLWTRKRSDFLIYIGSNSRITFIVENHVGVLQCLRLFLEIVSIWSIYRMATISFCNLYSQDDIYNKGWTMLMVWLSYTFHTWNCDLFCDLFSILSFFGLKIHKNLFSHGRINQNNKWTESGGVSVEFPYT